MKKRNIVILVVVFILIIGVLGVKKFIQSNNEVKHNSIAKISLKEQYEGLKKGAKPSMIIFSYDADCCENTKKFFNEYNSKANQLIKDYDKKFNILFINTGILKDDDKDVLMKIADENATSQLPALSIRDSKGKLIKTIEGIFDDKEVRELLDGVK